MPKRDLAPIGAPCWIELFSSDTDKSRAFYHELFGWTSESAGDEYGGYINFAKDGTRIAGCMRNDGSTGAPDMWSIYLATDNAQATCDAAIANGGTVIVPAMQVGPLGTMAVMTDAGGAGVGAWQSAEHTGFGLIMEPGAPYWFELHTRDFDKTVDFYRNVFKIDGELMPSPPGFRYLQLGAPQNAVAGIMDASETLPEGVPAHWSIYFAVENTASALERITKLGGSVAHGPDDSPFGVLAGATDPTGAQFRLRGES